MSFWDRFTQLCEGRGVQPASQKAAEMFGVTRSAISTWGKNKTTPKGETLAAIADALGVSVDYLLERTDDPAGIAASAPAPASAPAAHNTPRILTLYNQLDAIDQVRVESYIEGILSADKYRLQQIKKMG